MMSHFNAEFFRANRQRLLKLFTGTAPIVLPSNGLVQSSADMTFPFRQERNFWYLTGIDEPDTILVMDKGREYLILSEDYEHKARFEGALSSEQITAVSGVKEVLTHKDGWAKLANRLKKVKHVATLAPGPSYVQYYGFYTNPARSHAMEQIKAVNEQIEFLDLRQHFITMRMIKQQAELAAIEGAIAVTVRTLKTVTRKQYVSTYTEEALDNELRYQFRKHGASGLAFENVVAFGANGATIHHIQNATSLPKNGLVLLDVGAEVDHYAADITRVFSVGKPTKRMMQVYEQVSSSLEFALDLLRPGISHGDFEQQMEHVVGERLRSLGLIKTIDRENVRKYFPLYTAHHLGLDPHDMSDKEKALQPNMVLAVEPGIYIPEEGIGIRIEEDVIITENGCQALTSDLSRELTSLTIKSE